MTAFPKPQPKREPLRPGQRRRSYIRHRKPRRLDGPGSDPARLAFVRSLPCAAKGLPGHRCRGAIEANHDTRDRGMGQKAPDDRAFPLCHFGHADWHAARGCFKGWSKETRREWAEACIRVVQALATPGDDATHAADLEAVGLGRFVSDSRGQRVWQAGSAVENEGGAP